MGYLDAISHAVVHAGGSVAKVAVTTTGHIASATKKAAEDIKNVVADESSDIASTVNRAMHSTESELDRAVAEIKSSVDEMGRFTSKAIGEAQDTLNEEFNRIKNTLEAVLDPSEIAKEVLGDLSLTPEFIGRERRKLGRMQRGFDGLHSNQLFLDGHLSTLGNTKVASELEGAEYSQTYNIGKLKNARRYASFGLVGGFVVGGQSLFNVGNGQPFGLARKSNLILGAGLEAPIAALRIGTLFLRDGFQKKPLLTISVGGAFIAGFSLLALLDPSKSRSKRVIGIGFLPELGLGGDFGVQLATIIDL